MNNPTTDLSFYSDADLLRMALTMLDVAKEQQKGKNKWLTNNSTLEAIRQRVEDNTHNWKYSNLNGQNKT
jgi:hypothetical protein